FEEKYSGKDGPSASVACALLLDALIRGQENDPQFAVTGDMNADGEVQPIGGVPAKLRGATNGKCKYVGIPAKNESYLPDLLMSDGPAPFAGIQVFSIDKFDDALALANAQKPEALQKVVSEFSKVQEVLNRNKAQMAVMLRNHFVVNK